MGLISQNNPTDTVLYQVAFERINEDVKWGERDYLDGTGETADKVTAVYAKELNKQSAREGAIAWRDILDEEVFGVYAESDPAKLRAELVRVAAVAVAWVEAIDRRSLRVVTRCTCPECDWQ